MRKMGFNQQWCNLIMQCLKTIQYSILINGQPVGNFRPSHGICQGDPLSPYTFIIWAETLSSLLTQTESTGWLAGVTTSPKGPKLNHLFFANDSLFVRQPRVSEGDYINFWTTMKRHQIRNWIKKRHPSFLVAILVKKPMNTFFSYLASIERKCMIHIWGYLHLWESLEFENSKVSKTEFGSCWMIGKLNSFLKQGKRLFWKQLSRQFPRTAWAFSCYLWPCVRILIRWCKISGVVARIITLRFTGWAEKS